MSAVEGNAAWRRILADGVEDLQLRLPLGALQLFEAYVAGLLRWNRVYNLTALKTADEVVRKHLLDSLAVVPWVPDSAVLDVGTGPGLPGIPLCVARPKANVTMIDSNGKKAAFVRQMVGELGLANARVECARVEDWQSPMRFPTIVCRAFADLDGFVRSAQHLLAPGGRFLAMKGRHTEAEIEALPPGFVVSDVRALRVPGIEAERHLVTVTRQ